MRIISFVLLLTTFFAQAQQSILYEISGNGLSNSSYLFGTIHVQDESAFNWNDSVFWAIDQCEKSAFELDFELKRSDFEFDTTKIRNFLEYFTSELIPQVMAEIPADTLGYRLVRSILPIYKMVMSNQFGSNKRSLVVDQYLQSYSRQKEKEIIGIETYKEQLDALLGSDFTGLTDMIMDMLKSDDWTKKILEMPGGVTKLVDAYSNLDFNELCTQINEVGDLTNPFANAFYSRIFIDRNDLMFERTKDLIKNESVFIAVGCGHLCGENGLVTQYRNLGYTVRPVNVGNKSKALNISWETRTYDDYSVDLPEGYEIENTNSSFFYGSVNSDAIYTSHGMAKFSVDIIEAADEVTESYDFFDLNQIEDIAVEEDYITDDEIEESPIDVEPIDIESDNEEAIEEYSEENYNQYEEDEAVVYDEVEPEKNPYNPKDYITDEMKEYGDIVANIIKTEMAKSPELLMGGLMNLSKSTKDTMQLEINGVLTEVVRTYSILNNSMTATVVSANDEMYELTVTGDPAVLQSKEVLRFFESFKLN